MINGRYGAMNDIKDNDFQDSMKIGNNSELDKIWQSVYQEFFPTMKDIIKGNKCYCYSQIKGIDKIIYLENGNMITVDEKVRINDHGDIALEYISNDYTNALGWVEKQMFCNYIAYMILFSREVHFLDYQKLKIAWEKNKEEWFKLYSYKIVKARNEYYYTLSLPIPKKVLSEAMGEIKIIKF